MMLRPIRMVPHAGCTVAIVFRSLGKHNSQRATQDCGRRSTASHGVAEAMRSEIGSQQSSADRVRASDSQRVNFLLLTKHSRRDLSTYAVLCLASIQAAAAAAAAAASVVASASASASAETPALLG
ncbi:uncharacterized protein BDZ83DRAFT_729107 [Colletotrichum acutatum]|uniref:Uncharacterized protein n=1 Tax=Glomerella acutata TaxID=27357 RepID=A0AAD8URH9_GLOAC|nr:uncharacterized protein BDZ83DRAFT_729107 [Colletotrichum acutatum]KAK1727055.1 hypothetical protein BDZ83DRAFT_729107 [Colletotrichum acutatum]